MLPSKRCILTDSDTSVWKMWVWRNNFRLGSYTISQESLLTEQVDFKNISKVNNLNFSMELPDTNPNTVPNINLDKHIYILYSITILIALVILIIIILNIKKYICVDSQNNKVGRLNRKVNINLSIILKEIKSLF